MPEAFYWCQCCHQYHRAGFRWTGREPVEPWVWSRDALPPGAQIVDAPALASVPDEEAAA
jgi:hypothetical protein